MRLLRLKSIELCDEFRNIDRPTVFQHIVRSTSNQRLNRIKRCVLRATIITSGNDFPFAAIRRHRDLVLHCKSVEKLSCSVASPFNATDRGHFRQFNLNPSATASIRNPALIVAVKSIMNVRQLVDTNIRVISRGACFGATCGQRDIRLRVCRGKDLQFIQTWFMLVVVDCGEGCKPNILCRLCRKLFHVSTGHNRRAKGGNARQRLRGTALLKDNYVRRNSGSSVSAA